MNTCIMTYSIRVRKWAVHGCVDINPDARCGFDRGFLLETYLAACEAASVASAVATSAAAAVVRTWTTIGQYHRPPPGTLRIGIDCHWHKLSSKFWSWNNSGLCHSRTEGLGRDYFAASEDLRKEDPMSCTSPVSSAIVLYHSCDSVFKNFK